MTDPMPRLLDQANLGAEARSLLTALEPTAGMPASARAQLDARMEKIAASPPAGAGAWPIGGPVVFGLLAAVGIATLGALPDPAPTPTAELPSAIERGAAGAYEEVRLVAPPTAPEPEPAATGPAMKPAASSQAASVADAGGLVEELRLLRAAKRALPGDPRSALAQVDAHAEKFPSGQLSDMREYLRLRAEVELGTSGVGARVQRFIETYPSSPFKKDVLQLDPETE